MSKTSLYNESFSSSAVFTPAAASHVANDVVGGAQEFANMGGATNEILITSVSLLIAGATAEATGWRLYLYNITPPSALADDAAHDIPSGDREEILGYVDLGTAVDLGASQWVQTTGVNKHLTLTSTHLYGYLVNDTTLTPAAVAHTVVLHAVAL